MTQLGILRKVVIFCVSARCKCPVGGALVSFLIIVLMFVVKWGNAEKLVSA